MRASVARTFAAGWIKAAHWRHLLTLADDEITARQRLERQALQTFLALPDYRYRRVFARLDGQRPTRRADMPARQGILLAIGTLGPGGAERQFVGTLKGLKAAGQQVAGACVYLATPAQRFFLPELEAAGLEMHVFGDAPTDMVAPQLRKSILALSPELHEIERYAATLTALNPAIAHLWLDDINVKGGIAAVLTGVPKIILSQRSLPPTNFGLHMPYMREAYRWLARQPGVTMLNNSEAGASAYEEWLGLQPGSIGVVRNGLAFDAEALARFRAGRQDFRRRLGIDVSGPLIGAVMRLTEEKRPFLWLEIASHIRKVRPDAQFLIVGDGPLRAQLESRAAEPDLAGSVHFAGHVQPALAAMAAMDLLLLTSRAEGLPNVLIEAQLLGIPAVAFPVGGAVEAIDHGHSGWLLDSAEPAACARSITRLLDDAPWRAAASRRGPDFVASRFGAERAIRLTLAAYGLATTHGNDA